jgi:hypothetical protein
MENICSDHIKGISRHVPRGTEENYEKPQSVVGALVKIRTGSLTNIRQKRYHLSPVAPPVVHRTDSNLPPAVTARLTSRRLAFQEERATVITVKLSCWRTSSHCGDNEE